MQSFLQHRRAGRQVAEQLEAKKNSPQYTAPGRDAEAQTERNGRGPSSRSSATRLGSDAGGKRQHEATAPEKEDTSAEKPEDERLGDWTQEVEKEEISTENPEPAAPAPAPSHRQRKGSEAEAADAEERAEFERVPTAQAGNADDDETSQSDRRRPQVPSARRSFGTNMGVALTGVAVRDRTTNEGGGDEQAFVVGWEGDDDPLNPHNWPNWKRWYVTVLVAAIGAVVGIASAIDSSALMPASREFHVSEVAESLATGLYLIGFGSGALFAGPVSETVGRNPVYIVTLSLFSIFIMASGLAPNYGAQLIFRFLAGFFGATPLVVAGGSVSDIWNPLERVYAFPIFANAAFMGPIMGPVMGGWIVQYLDWRWTEWITLIISGLVLSLVALFQPETYAGVLLTWRASHLRKQTGDKRYVAPLEVRQETFFNRLTRALYRPFLLTAREPIILLIALYLTVIYIVLFTFFDGYTYIYADIHGTSDGITGLCFLGIAIGLCFATCLVPLIYSWAKRDTAKLREQAEQEGKDPAEAKLPPEFRLWFSMLGGSVAIPVSLYWMAWTSDGNISIWSPLVASVFFGYGILCVFISSYQYIIDSYETFAASALASVTLIRYLAAGGMVVVGIPFYENLGVHYTLTILASISALLAPIPYVFYKFGHKLRKRSKYAVAFEE